MAHIKKTKIIRYEDITQLMYNREESEATFDKKQDLLEDILGVTLMQDDMFYIKEKYPWFYNNPNENKNWIGIIEISLEDRWRYR